MLMLKMEKKNNKSKIFYFLISIKGTQTEIIKQVTLTGKALSSVGHLEC